MSRAQGQNENIKIPSQKQTLLCGLYIVTTQELRIFEARLADKAARGNCMALEMQKKMRACSNDAERIEYLRGFVEQAQQAIFWAKEFVAKWERKCLKKERKRERRDGN